MALTCSLNAMAMGCDGPPPPPPPAEAGLLIGDGSVIVGCSNFCLSGMGGTLPPDGDAVGVLDAAGLAVRTDARLPGGGASRPPPERDGDDDAVATKKTRA